MTSSEAKARALIALRSTKSLLEMWLITEYQKKMDLETAMVRGWIMDELEKRNPEAMEAFIMDDSLEPETIFKYFN